MNDKRIRDRLQITSDELRHDDRYRCITYRLKGSTPPWYCMTTHDLSNCDPAAIDSLSNRMAIGMAREELKKRREASWLYTRPRAIRCWWMDNVWPFRKAYPLRVSSHPVVMFFRRRGSRKAA